MQSNTASHDKHIRQTSNANKWLDSHHYQCLLNHNFLVSKSKQPLAWLPPNPQRPVLAPATCGSGQPVLSRIVSISPSEGITSLDPPTWASLKPRARKPLPHGPPAGQQLCFLQLWCVQVSVDVQDVHLRKRKGERRRQPSALSKLDLRSVQLTFKWLEHNFQVSQAKHEKVKAISIGRHSPGSELIVFLGYGRASIPNQMQLAEALTTAKTRVFSSPSHKEETWQWQPLITSTWYLSWSHS